MKINKISGLLVKILVCVLAVVMLVPAIGASAVSEKTDEVGYETYTYWYEFTGKTRKAVYSKPMYEVKKVLTSSELGCIKGSTIEDVHTAKDGKTYVLDGTNSRIIVLDADYNVEKIISSVVDSIGDVYYFNKAKGIFVDNDNHLYIADTNNGRVIKCTTDGVVIRMYVLPDSHLIPAEFSYQPTKVAVDNKGYVYILSNGSYYGAILYSPNDEFLGFYGSNDVAATFMQAMSTLFNRLFMNNTKRSGMTSSLPYTFSDLWVDDEGFVYTATGGTATKSGQIKRLNPGGSNVLIGSDGTNFADEGVAKSTAIEASGGRPQSLLGVAVDKNGFMHVIDSTYGRVFIYDDNCKMISAFGGGIKDGRQDGTFRSLSAIAYNLNTDDIIVTDMLANTVTVFNITEYGALVKAAQTRTIVGDYEEAFKEWEQVLALDRNCQLAYAGLAKAYYVRGTTATDEAVASKNYDLAIKLAEEGYDRDTYSLAFNNVRSELIRENFTIIMIVIVLLVAGIIFLLVFSTKKKVRLIKNEKVHLATTMLTHPFDNFHEIKEKNLASLPICFIIIIVYYVFTVMETTAGGFAFTYFDPASYNALFILAETIGFVLLWSIANWAVCTLFSGKGKIKEIFTVTCYSLIPSLIGSIVYVIATNVLVPDEATFLTILTFICTAYTFIMIVAGTMIIHDYSFGKFIGTGILSLIGCGIVLFLIIAVTILLQQTWGFISTIYSEILKLF